VTHLAGYAHQLFSGAGLQSKLSFGNIRVYCSIVPCSIKNRCKYLNHMVEQDHRFIKRLVNPGMGFGCFNTARRTLRGDEAMNMIRQGQIQGVEKGDIQGCVEFVSQIFGIAA